MTTIKARNSAAYPSPAGITADPVVFAPLLGRLQVLLVERQHEPFLGRFALPGGFVGEQEDPAATAQRKLTEKTGVGELWLEQLATYAAPGRDPRGWIPSIAYLALTPAAVLAENSGPANWYPVDNLPELAFDHARIIADGVARLRGKLQSSNIAVALLPPEFTQPEARALYETITGITFEPSNFIRALREQGLIRETGRFRRNGPGRPAMLYEFVEHTPQWTPRRSRFPGSVLTA